MSKDDNGEKCFGAKHFSHDGPNRSWGLEELGQHARRQHEAIARGEQALAPIYWELGRALQFARKQLGRGQWGQFLKAQGITRVRACRARAIFRSHPSVEALSGLSVEDAYRQRHTCRVHRRSEGNGERASVESDEQDDSRMPREKSVEDLESYLIQVRDGADSLIDLAAFLESERRAAMFPLYRAATERLQYLGRLLGVEDARGLHAADRHDHMPTVPDDGNDERLAPNLHGERKFAHRDDKSVEKGGSHE